MVARSIVTYYFWGTWFTTPHARPGSWDGSGPVAAHRLGGMLFDQEYGLLLYAPMFALIVFAVRERREILVASSLLIAAYLLPVLLPSTNVHGWTGGWSPAARFWVPVVPLLAIMLALAMSRTPRAIVVTVVIVQIAISAYFWQNPKDLWNDGNGQAAICERSGFSGCQRLPSFVEASDVVQGQ
jgi:hypothetical protein